LLFQYREKAKVIAGGTELLALMKQKQLTPQYLINLKSIPNFEYINYTAGEGLKIGALTTLFEVSRSSIVNEKAKILVEAVQQRNPGGNKTRWAHYMATIGGHLSTTGQSAEIVPALIILEAKAVIEGPKGWKTIPLEEFFVKTGENALQNDEVLIEVRIPEQAPESGIVYLKSDGTPGPPPFTVAVLLKLDAKHVNVEDLKIVTGGITPSPLEASNAERRMKGNPIDNDLIEETAQIAFQEVCEMANLEATKSVKELIEEAIRQAVDRAIGDFALGY
jgi:carbon-monoxide dehydrogenase medium subunit